MRSPHAGGLALALLIASGCVPTAPPQADAAVPESALAGAAGRLAGSPAPPEAPELDAGAPLPTEPDAHAGAPSLGVAAADAGVDGGETPDADACTSDLDCPGAAPLCEAGSGQCVECLAHADCDEPARSRCDFTTHTCAPCRDHNVTDCEGIVVDGVGRNLCSAGLCIACIDHTDCSARASVCVNRMCIPCRADADCAHIPDRGSCQEGRCVSP